jgi:hypothetical protein
LKPFGSTAALDVDGLSTATRAAAATVAVAPSSAVRALRDIDDPFGSRPVAGPPADGGTAWMHEG